MMSDFGLASQGMDTARSVRQNYDINAQNMDIQRRRLEMQAAEQDLLRRQREQELRAGEMGLEDAVRVRADQAAERAAVAAGGGDVGQTLDNLRSARIRAGNFGGAQQIDQQRMQSEMTALSQLARDAATGVDARQAESNLRRYGLGGDAIEGSLKFSKGENGDDIVTMTGRDGTPRQMNLTAFTRATSKPTFQNIGAHGTIQTQPGTPTKIISPIEAPAKDQWEMGTIKVQGVEYPVRFNKRNGAAELINTEGSPIASNERMQMHTAGDQTYVNVGGQWHPVIPGTPGTPARPGGWLSPDKPAVPGTPATLGPPLQMPGSAVPPVEGAVQFTFPPGHPRAGETIWAAKGKDGKPYEVRGGALPQATPAPQAAPAAAPQPQTRPAAKPPAPAPTPEPTVTPPISRPQADARKAEIARMNTLSGGSRRPGAEQELEVKKAETAAQFTQRLERFGREDRVWLDSHMIHMTNAQKKAYREKLDKTAKQRIAENAR